jgi:hypothetical protein
MGRTSKGEREFHSLRVAAGTFEKIAAVLEPKEDRNAFIEKAIANEVRRRLRARS